MRSPLLLGLCSLSCLAFFCGCSNPSPAIPHQATSTVVTVPTSATTSPTLPVTSTSTSNLLRSTSSTAITPTDPTGIPLLIQSLTKHQTFQPRGSCEVTSETLEIQPTPLLSEDKRTRLNEMLRRDFLTLDRGTSTERVVSFDEYVDAPLKNCAEAIDEMNQDSGEYPPSMLDYAYTTTIEVMKNDHSFVSLRISGYEYTGGAHPNSWSGFITLDTQQEKELTLGDLVQPDKLKAFMQIERRQLIKDYSDMLFEEQLRDFKTFVAQPAKSTSSTEMTDLSNFDRFYLTNSFFVTEYSPYEIGPYAAGFLNVQFPLTKFRSMIRPELIDRLFPTNK